MADKRLIDANELMYIESDANAYSEEWNADYEKGFKDCLDKVMALPTVEAQPVKHGRWMNRNGHPVSMALGCYSAKCSECELYSGMQYTNKPYNYCPFCGAKMDLKEI